MVPQSCRLLALLLSFLVVIVSFYLASYFNERLPPPIVRPEQKKFCAGEARKTLDRLTNFGPRPAGSYANEILAVGLITSSLKTIKNGISNTSQLDLEYHVQTPTGSFWLDAFGAGFIQRYSLIKNVVARLKRKGRETDSTILLNCHYDSVPQGPGASDDGCSCAIILGVIRALVSDPDLDLRHDILFLFNGAEETGLLAAHGFITQHEWAPSVKAFLNLESAGSGGRELLFQSGPGHIWLLESYLEAAPYPFANVIGQEVFQSGVIPSDTDFRIFRDFGHIPGLDIAYIKDGYVYHTEHDTSWRIPDGSIQRAGDNVLAVSRSLALDPDLDKESSGYSPVFFDIFGLFMISYPSWAGVLINVLVVISVVAVFYVDLGLMVKKTDLSRTALSKSFLACFLSCLVVIVVSTAVAAFTGFLLGLLGFTMSWFKSPILLFFLYSVPSVAVIFVVLYLTKLKLAVWIDGVGSHEFAEETLYLHSHTLLLAALNLVLTAASLNSSYYLSWCALSCLIWWLCARGLSFQRLGTGTWLNYLLYLFLQVPSLMQTSYLVQMVLTIFVPVMGRRGASSNPDIFLGLLVAVMTVLLLQMMYPVFISFGHKLWFAGLCLLTFVVTLLVVFFSGAGFPYSGDALAPAQQRLYAFHTKRTLHDRGGRVAVEDGGFFVARSDFYWAARLAEKVDEYREAVHISEGMCEERIGCGVPQPSYRLSSMTSNLWIQTVQPQIRGNETSLQLKQFSQVGKTDTYNVTLDIVGPSRIVVLMWLEPGVEILQWSLSDRDSVPNSGLKENRPWYYVQIVQGLHLSPQQVWLVVSGWQPGQLLMQASVAGHYFHGPDMVGPVLKKFIKKHPDWTSLAAWTVDYKYYFLSQ